MLPADTPSDVPDGTERLIDFLEDVVDDELRSVTWYDGGDFEILYARDDVLAEYTEEEVEDVIDELTMTSLSKPVKEDIYAHGELECLVECYEGGIEMQFVLGDGEGIAISLEPQAFATHRTFIGKCLNEVGVRAE